MEKGKANYESQGENSEARSSHIQNFRQNKFCQIDELTIVMLYII